MLKLIARFWWAATPTGGRASRFPRITYMISCQLRSRRPHRGRSSVIKPFKISSTYSTGLHSRTCENHLGPRGGGRVAIGLLYCSTSIEKLGYLHLYLHYINVYVVYVSAFRTKNSYARKYGRIILQSRLGRRVSLRRISSVDEPRKGMMLRHGSCNAA